MKQFLSKSTRFLFFTGKGGVGKTSMACSTAIGLAKQEKKVLLISTDPASNLDEVLEQEIGSNPTEIKSVSGLSAMNINPLHAAAEYKEKMVGPYRGVLPEAAIQQMEEQLSGACTVEIAGFNEFSKFIGDQNITDQYEHIVLDTAPTGHTLRLLNLPAAWNNFIAENQTGSSCLGPVSGLAEYKSLFEKVVNSLKNPELTLLVLVSRAENMSLKEAARASDELHEAGLTNQHLILNGLFLEQTNDPIAEAFYEKTQNNLNNLPESLKVLEKTMIPFRPEGIMGIEALTSVAKAELESQKDDKINSLKISDLNKLKEWDDLICNLEADKRGVIMTMGKGGVGKTTMAAMIASELAKRGHSVLLSTTDPASHVIETAGESSGNLQVGRIDPKIETERHVESIISKNRDKLSAEDFALLEEELRSPCIEEIAVFQAFARTLAQGKDQFIVLDTAPTGHTLLLLDSTEAYHKEVSKSAEDLPEAVKELLPRIRDPKFTKILLVTLPEATPTHEAEALQEDLKRANIDTFGWIINRSFAVSGTQNETLKRKGQHELQYIQKTANKLSNNCVISPWLPDELSGAENLAKLKNLSL